MLQNSLKAGVAEAEIELAKAYALIRRPSEAASIFQKLALLGDSEAMEQLIRLHRSEPGKRIETEVWRYFYQGHSPVADLHREFRARHLGDTEAVQAQWLVKKLDLEAQWLEAERDGVEPELTEEEVKLMGAESFENYYSWLGPRLEAIYKEYDAAAAWEAHKELQARIGSGEALPEEADWWLRLAGELGSDEAQLELWRFYSETDSPRHDAQSAQLWLERAARVNPEGKYHLAKSWLDGDMVNEAGATRVARLLLESSDAGYVAAETLLEDLVLERRLISSFEGSLLDYLEKKSGKGLPAACYLLGLQKGRSIARETAPGLFGRILGAKGEVATPEEVIKLLTTAADGGIVEAKTVLAKAFLFPAYLAFDIDGVPGIDRKMTLLANNDGERALALLEEAAEASDADAQAIIEILRYHGKIVRHEPTVAAERLYALAKEGYAPAAKLFSRDSLNGAAPEENDEASEASAEADGQAAIKAEFRTAVETYYEAYVKRNPEAMMVIAQNEELTKEFENPTAERLHWLNEAAKEEWVEAYITLGNIYWEGVEGVEADKIRAFRWYSAAADLGHADAAFLVGAAYAHGDPVGQDEELALQYLQASAELGNTTAAQLLQQLEKISGKKASEEEVKSLLAEKWIGLENTPVQILGFSGGKMGALSGFSWGRPLLRANEADETFKGDKDGPYFVTSADSFAGGMIRLVSLYHITPVMFLENGIVHTGLSERIVGVIIPEQDYRNCLAVLVVREGNLPEPHVQIYSAKLGNLRAEKEKRFTIKIPGKPYINTDHAGLYIFADGREIMTNGRVQYHALSGDRYANFFDARMKHLSEAKEDLETTDAQLWDQESTLRMIAREKPLAVRVRVSINTFGMVRDVELLGAAPTDEAQRVIRAAAELLFLPALKDGEPVGCEKELEFQLI